MENHGKTMGKTMGKPSIFGKTMEKKSMEKAVGRFLSKRHPMIWMGDQEDQVTYELTTVVMNTQSVNLLVGLGVNSICFTLHR
jgi:hypothetical protein